MCCITLFLFATSVLFLFSDYLHVDCGNFSYLSAISISFPCLYYSRWMKTCLKVSFSHWVNSFTTDAYSLQIFLSIYTLNFPYALGIVASARFGISVIAAVSVAAVSVAAVASSAAVFALLFLLSFSLSVVPWMATLTNCIMLWFTLTGHSNVERWIWISLPSRNLELWNV